MEKTRKLPVDAIRIDGGTQARVRIDQATVDDYANKYRNKVELPPLLVGDDGEAYWAIDCFHRLEGAKAAGIKKVECQVVSGELDDFRWLALSQNQSHGLRRTNEDKRRAVEMALQQHPDYSDRRIAEHVGVSNELVGECRAQLSESDSSVAVVERTGRDGKTRKSGSGRRTTDDSQHQPDAPEDEQRHPDDEPAAKPSANGQAAERAEPVPSKPPLDRVGVRIPTGMLDVFDPAHEETRQQLLTACRKVRELIDRYAQTPAGAYFRRDLRAQGDSDDTLRFSFPPLHDLMRSLKEMAPHCCLCPYCSARTGQVQRDCRCCEGRGWTPARVFADNASTPRDYLDACMAHAEEIAL